jgi:hypothetical protein
LGKPEAGSRKPEEYGISRDKVLQEKLKRYYYYNIKQYFVVVE